MNIQSNQKITWHIVNAKKFNIMMAELIMKCLRIKQAWKARQGLMWPAETQNLFACWNKDERINSEGVWKHLHRYFSKKWWKLGLGIQISQIQWNTILKNSIKKYWSWKRVYLIACQASYESQYNITLH